MLDERTLLFMLSVVPALMALVAAGLRTGQGDLVAGLGSWAAGLACFSFASLVVAVWPMTAIDARIVLSNAGFAPAVTLFGYGLLKFFGRSLRPWWWAVAGMALYMTTVALSQQPWQASWRIAIFSLYWLTMIALAGRALWRSGECRTCLGGVVLMAALLVMAVALSARLMLAITSVQQVLLLAGGVSGFMALFLATTVVGLVLGTLGLVLLASDRMRRRLEHLARHDSLTGLLTRNGFAALAAQSLATARRERTPVGFLLADIDHFKAINDGYGHQAGDAVLAAVAHALRDASREIDLVSRFGGEEFAVLLPATDVSQALQIGERLRQQMAAASVEIEGMTLRATISIGVASLPAAEASIERLYREADAALYRAKQRGRNRVEACDNTIVVPAQIA